MKKWTLIGLTILIINFLGLTLIKTDPFYLKLLKEGEEAFLNGDYRGCIQNLKIASFGLLENKEFSSKIYIYLALAYYYLNDRENSEIYLEKFLNYNPGQEINSFNIPPAVKKNLMNLISHYQRYKIAVPKTTPPQIEGNTQNVELKIKEYSEELKKNPSNLKAYYELYYLYQSQGNLKKAEKIIDKLIKQNPEDGRAYFLKGKIYFDKKKYEDALRYFALSSDLLESDRDLKNELYYYIGKACYHWKNFSLAKAYLSNVENKNTFNDVHSILENIDSLVNSYLNRARNAKKFKERINWYEKVLEVEPLNSSIYLEAINFCLTENKLNQALEIIERAKKNIKPLPLEFYLREAEVLERKNKLTNAIKILKIAQLQFGNKIEILYGLGKILIKQGNYEQAAIYFNQVKAFKNNYKDTKYYLNLINQHIK